MCKCTLNIRTPFCGKGDCVWPVDDQAKITELLPCPFCGNTAKFYGHSVSCGTCGAQIIEFGTTSIEKWNTRAHPSAPPPASEELREALKHSITVMSSRSMKSNVHDSNIWMFAVRMIQDALTAHPIHQGSTPT